MKKRLQLEPPIGAEAAIYWLEDQLVFQSVEEGALKTKFISSTSARQAFNQQPVDSGWLPVGVNRWGAGSKGMWMLRWHAPAMYRITIDEGKNRKLKVPMPALVWFGQKHNYFIWAVLGNRFDPKAALYRAPLPNVNSTGLICFGKNEHPNVAKGGFDVAWRTFWDAPFNDHQDDRKSHAFPEHVNGMLKTLAKERATTYPVKDLISAGGNLDSTIERFTRRGDDAGYVDVQFVDEDDFDEEFDE